MNVSTKRSLSPLEIRLLGRRLKQAGVFGVRKMGPAKPMQETAIIAESHKIIVQYLEDPSKENYAMLTEPLSGEMCAWCKKLGEGNREAWEVLKKAVSGIRGTARRRTVRDSFASARKHVKKRTGEKIPFFEEFVS